MPEGARCAEVAPPNRTLQTPNEIQMKLLPGSLFVALVFVLHHAIALCAVDEISWLEGAFCWSDPSTSTSGKVTYKVIGPDKLSVTKEVKNPHARSIGTVQAKFTLTSTGFTLDEGIAILTFVKRDLNHIILSRYSYGRTEIESNIAYFRCNEASF